MRETTETKSPTPHDAPGDLRHDRRTKLILAYSVAVVLVDAMTILLIFFGRVPGWLGMVLLLLGCLSLLLASANGLRLTRAWAADLDAERDAAQAAPDR